MNTQQNPIVLSAVLARDGRLLCFREGPDTPWELPGGPFPHDEEDIDAAMDAILRAMGVHAPAVEEDFVQTVYMPLVGGGQAVVNLYAPSEWRGEPAHPAGHEAGWFGLEEFEGLEMNPRLKSALLSVFGFGEDEEDALMLELQTDVEAFADDGPDWGAMQRSAFREPAASSAFGAPGRPEAAPSEDEELEALAMLEAMELDDELAPHAMPSPMPRDAREPHASGAPRPSAAAASAPGETRRERGLDVLRTIGGGRDPNVAREAMLKSQPEIADDIIDFALGEVWARPEIDRKTRSLQVVAMLAAMGGRPRPLRGHINGALNHGATPAQIVETLRMVAVYAGFPATLEAWPVMEEVFAARGIERPGRPT